MTTTKEKIGIMQHFEDGNDIKYRSIALKYRWRILNKNNSDTISWNWYVFEYRKVKKPRVFYARVYSDTKMYLYISEEEADFSDSYGKSEIRSVKLIEVLDDEV